MTTTLTDVELAAKHKYRLPTGEIAINVTAITGMLDDGKSGGMAYVAADLTRQGLDYRTEWNKKRDAGTRAHAVCEAWLRGEESFVLDEDAGFVDALEKFWIDHRPEMVECEQVALSTAHGYGGRFDMVADLTDGRWLLDLKSGKEYPVAHTLQLAAYRFCDGIAVYDDDGSLKWLRSMPEVDRCGCVHVRRDGTYSRVEYPADDRWFGHFCALVALQRDMRAEEMAGLVKAARAANREVR